MGFPCGVCPVNFEEWSNNLRMWELVKNVWPDFSPQSISIDFEMAAINSISTSFPQCEIRCCLFHLVRNMKKILSEFDLMSV